MYKSIQRRDFLKIFGLLTSSLLIPHSLIANEKNSCISSHKLHIKTDADSNKELTIKYEISTDKSFHTITKRKEYKTQLKKDFILEIDMDNLSHDKKYYYRLSAFHQESNYWLNQSGQLT